MIALCNLTLLSCDDDDNFYSLEGTTWVYALSPESAQNTKVAAYILAFTHDKMLEYELSFDKTRLYQIDSKDYRFNGKVISLAGTISIENDEISYHRMTFYRSNKKIGDYIIDGN